MVEADELSGGLAARPEESRYNILNQRAMTRWVMEVFRLTYCVEMRWEYVPPLDSFEELHPHPEERTENSGPTAKELAEAIAHMIYVARLDACEAAFRFTTLTAEQKEAILVSREKRRALANVFRLKYRVELHWKDVPPLAPLEEVEREEQLAGINALQSFCDMVDVYEAAGGFDCRSEHSRMSVLESHVKRRAIINAFRIDYTVDLQLLCVPPLAPPEEAETEEQSRETVEAAAPESVEQEERECNCEDIRY
jgi:hypothetical protein